MKFVAKKFVLQSALDKAFGVTSKSAANPALQNVLIESLDDGSIRVVGSDGELTIIVAVEQVEVETAGQFLASSRVHNIIKACPDENVTIETSDVIHITCDKADWNVRVEQIEYPDIEDTHEAVAEIAKEDLRSCLTACRPAIESDNIRQTFSFIQIRDRKMRATDGSKFHQVAFDYGIEALLHYKAVQEIVRRLRNMALESVEFGENENSYTFKFDSDLLIVAKHNIEYPDVDTRMLNPALENDQRVSLDRSALVEAIKRVSLTADEDTNFLTIKLSGSSMELSTLDKWSNTSHENIPIHWEGSERTLGVNFNFLLDLLGAHSGAECNIFLGEDKGQRRTSLCFRDERLTGVLVQLRPDIGEAAKGSSRVRSAQQAPTGWGMKGVEADSVTADPLTRRRRQNSESEIEFEESADELDAENAASVLE